MTRFEMEISGQLGAFWKNHAEREVAQAVEWATNDAIVEPNGAIKWKSNGHYLMDDMCEKLEYIGFRFDREATRVAREAQDTEFLRAYRDSMKNHKPSAEELYEMEAAFGKGTKVVDVLTGQTIQL